MKASALPALRAVIAALAIIPGFHTRQVLAAEELPDTVTHLRDVVVTASRRPPATVQTLAGAELQSLSSTSVADALKYFAGVQIKDYGGLGGLKTINVRSLGAQHVGVYIDGVRLTNAQNGTIDLGKYSLSTLESVSLYNANRLEPCQSASEYASGATVYLQTRRPASDSLSVLAGIASFHTYRARLNAQICRRGWSAFVDAEYLNSGGDYPFRYKSAYEDTVGRRRNSDIRYTRIEGAFFKGGFASHVYCYVSERGCPGGMCAACRTNTSMWAANGTPTFSHRPRTATVSVPRSGHGSISSTRTNICATTPIIPRTRIRRASTTTTVRTTLLSPPRWHTARGHGCR